jgi:hypothetical protein
MDRIVVAMGRSIAPYADELLLLLPDHFEKDSDGVVQCLGSLVGAILADAEAPKTAAASVRVYLTNRTNDSAKRLNTSFSF